MPKLKCILLLSWLLIILFSQLVQADWLEITGEKGFNLDLQLTADQPELIWGQSLWLELQGQLGTEYKLQGYLSDFSNAPRKFFLELSGSEMGLRFGDSSFAGFGSQLVNYQGAFNGFSGYLQNKQHQLQIVAANPLTIPITERILVKTGENLLLLQRHPLQAETVQLSFAGRTLIAGVDYELDEFTGQLKLLFYPDSPSELLISYQALTAETIANQFLALKEQSSWGRYQTGFNYLTFQMSEVEAARLLGETYQTRNFDLAGVNLSGQVADWQVGVEYWRNFEKPQRDWDYLEHMEGTALTSIAFGESARPESWQLATEGKASLALNAISALDDPIHTRNHQAALAANYQLLQTDSRVSLIHNFAVSRDLRMLSKFNFWVFNAVTPLVLQVEFLTTANDYYYHEYQLNTSGWQLIECDFEALTLQQAGLPDLAKIYALRLRLGSMLTLQSGTIYLTEFREITKSLAKQRWSELSTTSGSSLKLQTITEILPGTKEDNQVMLLEYNLATGGAAALTYHFSNSVDLSEYQSISFQAVAQAPVNLGLHLLNQSQEVFFKEVALITDGAWHEYRFDLPRQAWKLNALQAVKISLTGATGAQSLKLDEVKVLGRKALNGAALRATAVKETESFKHQVEYQTVTPDYLRQEQLNSLPENKLRDYLRYQTNNYILHSLVEVITATETATKLPLRGEKLNFGIQHSAYEVNWWQNSTRINSELEPELSGETLETGLGWRQHWSWGEFNFKHRRFYSNLTELNDQNSNLFSLIYQQPKWHLQTDFWNEENLIESTRNLWGINFQSSYASLEETRWQLKSGAVYDAAQNLQKLFAHSELRLNTVPWFSLDQTLKLNATTQVNSAEYLLDHLLNWNLSITPVPEYQLKLQQALHLWHEQPELLTRQHQEELQLGYRSESGEKIEFFWRDDGINNLTKDTLNYHLGCSGKFQWFEPWWMELQLALQRETSQKPIALLRDTYQGSWRMEKTEAANLFFYGIEASGMATEWWRNLLNFGWEFRPVARLQYGGRINLGTECLKTTATRPVWGMEVFLAQVALPHQFNFKWRRQNYTVLQEEITLGYSFIKPERYILKLAGEYSRSEQALNQYKLHSELLFYLH